MSYDVIVVGARLAGSGTALLLARSGARVLAVDQARFPSDTLSTHQLQVPGVARLHRWGLLERVLATGVPPTRRVRFRTFGGAVVDSRPPTVDGVDVMISPRRTVLDALLLDAAREAGAEIREAVAVEDLVRDGDRVVGVRLRDKTAGTSWTERAGVVIGADGHRSTVARLVAAAEYRQRPATSIASYTYWDGLSMDGGEMYAGHGWAVGAWPTHDDLTMTYVARRAADWQVFRRDPEAGLVATLDDAGTLGKRIREARRIGPVRCTNDVGGAIRQASGPGWALAGDAGLHMDPITGLGMGHALRDADLVSAALAGPTPGRALARFGKVRDKQTRPLYDLTAGLAQLRDGTAIEERLFAATAADPQQSAAFFGVLAGAIPPGRFFSPRNLARLVGWSGFLDLARSRPR